MIVALARACVELFTPALRRVVGLSLALACDVVVENFRPGVLGRLGLDYETLRAHRPEIIMCSLSGYGQNGPMAAKPSVDTVVQALSGAMSVTGSPAGPPLKLGPANGVVRWRSRARCSASS